MAQPILALAAREAHGKLEPFTYDPGELGPEQIEVEVEYCGVCHSDVSMLNNEWGITQYPFVPGHEAMGRVVAVGSNVRGLPDQVGSPIGKRVGVGWFSGSCLHCRQCMSGNQNLCAGAESTIVGRHGGFATRVRVNWEWALPLPDGLDGKSAGPLFCGGITVFNPIVEMGVQPTDRVGVIGIGGLGHMAVQFLRHWGCEVYAFSSNPAKTEEILKLGAHHVVNSREANEMAHLAGKLDFILSTVNVDLDWNAYFTALAPKGRFHFVGVLPNPVAVPAFPFILGQKSVSGSPLGSPSTVLDMMDFCVRHGIAPMIETFKMSEANEALAHLEAGKARYRLVLENDLK